MRPTPPPVPVFVTSLVTIGVARLGAACPSMGLAAARTVMREIAAEICGRFAGRDLYVPVGAARKREARDAAIRAQFGKDGADGVARLSPARAAQLANKHGLSPRRIRSILAPMQRRPLPPHE